MVPQVVLERLPRNDFDQIAQHVSVHTVVESLAGLLHQWQPGQALDKLLEGRRLEQVGFQIQLPHRFLRRKIVSEPGCVREQVLDGNRLLRFCQRGILHRAARADLEVAQFRDKARDRLVEGKPPFLEELEHGHTRDHLGHGVDANDGVGLHRRARFQIAIAVGLEVNTQVAD